ncbi:hypothetical protein Acr_28g0004640 [Actinidia rufa]|uniref:Uncharacterized protein n=1 Tax=Actinidia rufa TaxID=165716 RepID=A0A7J0H9L5_9ERIC|nr:hypothetical protein Acr_28g0004640 [Actinidia rufa]
MSVVRCLLRGMGVPKYFWHMAVLTATYLINRTPSRILQGKTPLHILQPANTRFLIIPRIFGCYDPITRHMYHSLDVTFFETVLFFSDFTPSPGPGSKILAADDPIPPRPLPILEPPSSHPTPNGSLPPIASQDPSPYT